MRKDYTDLDYDNVVFSIDHKQLKFHFEQMNIREIFYISFYLSHAIINDLENEFYFGEYYVSKTGQDIILKGNVKYNKKLISYSGSSRGMLFLNNQEIDFIYQEELTSVFDNSIKRDVHFQYSIELLDDEESILKVFDFNKRKTVECFLVKKDFKLEDACYGDLENKSFKALFKER